MRSRRYPVKVMYLGVVANPQEERNFDGRVYLKRVSNQVTATRRSTNQRFSDDVDVNTAIMNGEWTEVVTLNMRAEEALDAISQHYDLDEYVAERLKMNYVSYTRNGKKETKKLNGNVTMGELGMKTRQDGEREPLLLKELKLGVEVQVGDVVEKDCSCDLEYMLRVMPEIGQALRNKFSWVAATDPVYLVMDNAGGGMAPMMPKQSTQKPLKRIILRSFGKYQGLRRLTCWTWVFGCQYKPRWRRCIT